MGNAYLVGGRYPQAIAAYQESLNFERSAIALANLTFAYAQNGDIDSAKVVALEALEMMTDLPPQTRLPALLALHQGCGCVEEEEVLALALALPPSELRTEAIAMLRPALDARRLLARPEDWRSLFALARRFQEQGQNEQALPVYESAVAAFEYLDVPGAEAVYRQYLTLLLDAGEVDRSLEVLERLRIEELEALLGIPCDWMKAGALAVEAAIHIVPLEEKSYVILERPSGRTLYAIPATKAEIEAAARELAYTASDIADYSFRRHGQKLYDWLIRPLEADLPSEGATLTFVGSTLSSVPIAALYDGERFLVEKYALEQGWRVGVERQPVSLDKVVAFALPTVLLRYVEPEVNAIAKATGARTFVGEQFTRARLEAAAGQFPNIVHFATHAGIGDRRGSAYVQAYDGPILMSELEKFLVGKNIDLVVFSACRTGEYDSIVRVTLRAGVGTSVATIWYVNDRASWQLSQRFYQYLQEGRTVPQALRAAQIDLIRLNVHPAGWSSFGVIN